MCTYVTKIIDYYCIFNIGDILFLYFKEEENEEKKKKNNWEHIWLSQKGGINLCIGYISQWHNHSYYT